MLVDQLTEIFSTYKEKNIIEVLKQHDSIILFGPVSETESIRTLMEKNALKISAFCDTNSANWGSSIEDIPIISHSDLLKCDLLHTALCIVGVRKDYLIGHLKDLGIKKYFILIDDGRFLPLLEKYAEFHLDHCDEIRETYHLLSDDASRNTFLDLLRFKLTSNFPHSLWDQSVKCYFHPIVGIRINDRIFDGGARIGDTALKFAEHLNNQCKIFSFEPEKRNYEMMEKNIKEYHLQEVVQSFHVGLWAYSGELRLKVSHDAKYSGCHQISEQGDEMVKVISLDDFVRERKVVPDLIKLDVECAEMQVLLGAQETILTYRPRLIISLYHKTEDLWEIPLFINSLKLGYNFYLVQHDPAMTETVLYAIASN